MNRHCPQYFSVTYVTLSNFGTRSNPEEILVTSTLDFLYVLINGSTFTPPTPHSRFRKIHLPWRTRYGVTTLPSSHRISSTVVGCPVTRPYSVWHVREPPVQVINKNFNYNLTRPELRLPFPCSSVTVPVSSPVYVLFFCSYTLKYPSWYVNPLVHDIRSWQLLRREKGRLN